MIRYHGGPITPESAALACWKRSHAMVSFANPDQATLAFAVADIPSPWIMAHGRSSQQGKARSILTNTLTGLRRGTSTRSEFNRRPCGGIPVPDRPPL